MFGASEVLHGAEPEAEGASLRPGSQKRIEETEKKRPGGVCMEGGARKFFGKPKGGVLAKLCFLEKSSVVVSVFFPRNPKTNDTGATSV